MGQTNIYKQIPWLHIPFPYLPHICHTCPEIGFCIGPNASFWSLVWPWLAVLRSGVQLLAASSWRSVQGLPARQGNKAVKPSLSRRFAWSCVTGADCKRVGDCLQPAAWAWWWNSWQPVAEQLQVCSLVVYYFIFISFCRLFCAFL